MKALKRKKSAELLKLGEERRRAKRDMSPADFAEWKSKQPAFRHEAKPDKTILDLDRRLARLASLSVSKKFKDKLPCTGVAALRELSKIGEFWLEKLFEVDLIGPRTTRAQIDVLRGLQTGRPVAPRHKPRAKR